MHVLPYLDALLSNVLQYGFVFQYWQNEEDLDALDINNHRNIQFTKVPKMFVAKRFHNFKEEILHYRSIQSRQYAQAILPKAVQLFTTDTAKQMVAFRSNDVLSVNIDYGIKNGEPITMEHLIAVTLYTDYSSLTTIFTSTFRKMHQYESIEQVKWRNQKYWWMSKRLYECVQLYGAGGGKQHQEILTGPFYTGMSKELALQNFIFRAASPLSTSAQLKVAMNFSGETGIVIEIANNVPFHQKYVRAFDARWTSRYNEEQEFIFFGSQYFTAIQSVTATATATNYKEIISAMAGIDRMIHGLYVKEKPMIAIINQLIYHPDGDEFDPYIYETFLSYTNHQENIVLNLHQLDCNNDEDLLELFMEPLIPNKQPSSFENQFKPTLLNVYPNVHTMYIYTSKYYTKDDREGVSGSNQVVDVFRNYPISMPHFLQRIQIYLNLEIIIVKALRDGSKDKFRGNKDFGSSWITEQWSSSGKSNIGSYRKSYKMQHFDIQMKEPRETVDGYIEDTILIQKIR